MDVYLVVHAIHHKDEVIRVFSTEADAIAQYKIWLREARSYGGHRDPVAHRYLPQYWATAYRHYAVYNAEGDHVRVERHTLDGSVFSQHERGR